LQRDTAHHFEVGKANAIERRRLQWTTQYNLDVWFTTSWKQVLINLGFGREATPAKIPEHGEVVLGNDQMHRIGNVDKTDGSIDERSTQSGGRPALVFLAKVVTGGATAANKSGYSSTIALSYVEVQQLAIPFHPTFS
jgi:hypothetical protein